MKTTLSSNASIPLSDSTLEYTTAISPLELCQNLLESSQEFFYVSALDSTLIYISPAYKEMLGYAPKPGIPISFISFLHPDHAAQITQIIAEVIASGRKSNEHELRFSSQNDDIRWIKSSFAPFKDSQDRIVGWLCTGHDITAYKKLGNDLAEATEFFDSVINAVPNPIFIKDENHRMLRVNKAHCDLFGLTVQQIMELDDATLPEDELQAYWESDDQALASDTPIENEQKITDAYGNQHFVLAKKVAHQLPNGKKVIIATIHDITGRKAAAEELRKSKEAAESANQLKSTFLSTITHELRTPINGVMGMTSLLLDTPLTDSQIDLIQTIRTSSETLLTLINSVLDFSKIEANRLELEATDFDLQICIEESLDLVAPQATTKGLNLAYIIDHDVPLRIRQDSTRVRQILANLLSNAVKFTDSGEVVVKVSSKPIADSLFELHFAVQDTGIGIPADRLNRLFQSFSQVDASTSRRYGGTGLGLAISKRLAEMLSGTMWAASIDGTGSTFYFTIQAQQSQSIHGIDNEDFTVFNGKDVLVVSDSEATRRLLCFHLEHWGLNVQIPQQSTIESLWQKVSACELVIIDSKFRDIEKLQLLYELQQTPLARPVILLIPLGTRPQEDKDGGKMIPVSKPIHASQLHDALMVAMGQGAIHTRRNMKRSEFDSQLAQIHPLRILLAEDNSINQKVAVGILSRHGYRVDIAGNGLEVLEALERQSYDVIFMDVNMPEMDGFAATKAIRNEWIEVAVQPHIIALTANSSHDDYDRCIEAGMNDYISKPLQVKELVAALSRAHQNALNIG